VLSRDPRAVTRLCSDRASKGFKRRGDHDRLGWVHSDEGDHDDWRRSRTSQIEREQLARAVATESEKAWEVFPDAVIVIVIEHISGWPKCHPTGLDRQGKPSPPFDDSSCSKYEIGSRPGAAARNADSSSGDAGASACQTLFTISLPAQRTGVQLRAPEGAKRSTSPSAVTPC